MRVGLIDVDSHNFPNLALMKLSAYHKQIGDQVEWWNGLRQYEVVYQSKVFDNSYSKDMDFCVNAEQVIKGGTGYGLDNQLPDSVEHQCPDYDLYQIKNTAYGYLTRGCPMQCSFCIVSRKEGTKSEQVAELNEFWNGQKEIKLLDPNITACKDSEKLFEKLIESGAWIDFTQGLDVRLLTDRHAEQLNRMRLKLLHFAWDQYEFQTYEKLKRIRPLLKYNHRRLIVYVLTNFDTTHEQDLERVYKLRELGYDPYVMIFDKGNAPRETRLLQRWCNNRRVYNTIKNFRDFDPKQA